MNGIGSDVRIMETAITTVMKNKKVDRMRDDKMNLLVILPKGS